MKQITPLSETVRAIILGSLLGDGSLKIHRQYRNARFAFRHSEKQKDYFFWKVKQLKEISSARSVWRQSKDGKDGWGTVKWRYQSKALPQLTKLYKLTNPNGKFKIRRKWLNLLKPLSLAILWQDDGSIIANGRKGVICTDSFPKNNVQLLCRYLRVVWNVKTTVAPKSVKNPNEVRLWFRSTGELQAFLRIVLPYLKVEQMIPKFILLYHDHQLQQRWISEISRLSGIALVKVNYYLQAKRKLWKNYSKYSENDIVQS